jgi:hypothetical protein
MRLLTLLAAAAIALAVPAYADNWKKVGSVTFQDPFLEQTIAIGADAGQIRALRFDVKGNDVEIASVRIYYHSGSSEEIRVRSVFKAGTSSRRIDLPGELRKVKQITVLYRARGQATFDVVADIKDVPEWIELGCKTVGFFADRDVITVNRGDGPFTSIRLRVARLPVEFLGLKVVFGNGSTQAFNVRVTVPAGVTTNAINLTGEKRNIRRIELLYRSVPTQNKTAVVCADGYRVPN